MFKSIIFMFCEKIELLKKSNPLLFFLYISSSYKNLFSMGIEKFAVIPVKSDGTIDVCYILYFFVMFI